MAQFDVLSVGDTATDVFIRLSDAHVRIREDDHGQWMDLPFGGKVPFDYAVVVDGAERGKCRRGVRTAWTFHRHSGTRRE